MKVLFPWQREMTPAVFVEWIIVIGLLMRLALAGMLGLGVDESYLVSIARTPSLSYFEHPPLAFWLTHLSVLIYGSESSFVVRLPFMLLFAGTTWLTFRVGALLFGEWEGAWAALLLNLSLVFSVTSGGWALPDGPLMCCMMAAILCLVHALFDVPAPDARRTDLSWWIRAGVCTGLAMLSKYHGVFIGAGTLAFLITNKDGRRRLGQPGPWIAAAIALAIFSPALIWNASHHWASFRFQGARGAPASGLHLSSLLTNLAGQAAYLLPWIWVPLVVVLVQALRAGPSDARRWLLCCLAGGPLLVFTLATLNGNVGLPHWEAPGYLVLFPLLGAAVVARLARRDALTRGWVRLAAVGFALVVGIAGTHLANGWITRLSPHAFGRRDPGLDLLDWKDLRGQLGARGLMDGERFYAGTDWIDAGKLSYALGPKKPVVCLCDAPHHFAFVHDQSAFLGEDAVIVHSGAPINVRRRLSPYFTRIDSMGLMPVRRSDRTAMLLDVYLAHGFRKPFPYAGGM
jgi:hypothetical protein